MIPTSAYQGLPLWGVSTNTPTQMMPKLTPQRVLQENHIYIYISSIPNKKPDPQKFPTVTQIDYCNFAIDKINTMLIKPSTYRQENIHMTPIFNTDATNTITDLSKNYKHIIQSNTNQGYHKKGFVIELICLDQEFNNRAERKHTVLLTSTKYVFFKFLKKIKQNWRLCRPRQWPSTC